MVRLWQSLVIQAQRASIAGLAASWVAPYFWALCSASTPSDTVNNGQTSMPIRRAADYRGVSAHGDLDGMGRKLRKSAARLRFLLRNAERGPTSLDGESVEVACHSIPLLGLHCERDRRQRICRVSQPKIIAESLAMHAKADSGTVDKPFQRQQLQQSKAQIFKTCYARRSSNGSLTLSPCGFL